MGRSRQGGSDKESKHENASSFDVKDVVIAVLVIALALCSFMVFSGGQTDNQAIARVRKPSKSSMEKEAMSISEDEGGLTYGSDARQIRTELPQVTRCFPAVISQ